jgi:hypothetical protein
LSSKLLFKDTSFDDYVSIDDNLAICKKLDENSIIDELTNREDVEMSSGSDTEIDEPNEEKTITFKEAIDLISKLKTFNMSNEKIPEHAMHCLEEYEKSIIESHIFNSKQTQITDYFLKN